VQLSKRLDTLASLVPQGATLVDVGTDHGYLPIYLRNNKIIKSCIACDINKGPLENAAKHILRYEATNIELRQGNGLEAITSQDEIDTILIAGMGGYLISDILKNNTEVVKGSNLLILQPQSDYEMVRKLIHNLGFAIIKEIFIEEDGKYYTILCNAPGQEVYTKEIDYIYGKKNLENPSKDFIEWMNKKENTLQTLCTRLASVVNQQERKQELEREYALHQEAMRCIQ
jgi:tRNA (adenine22-N1)-methyltransferase